MESTMPRKPRLEFEGAFYHVFSRGNRRAAIFWNADDFREFEDWMLDMVERMGIHLYAWCLIPNHFHLLLETPLANLSTFMQRLLTQYSKYFDRCHQQVGHVFQGRYNAIVCDRESYFLELLRYVHLNSYRSKKLGILPEEEWP